MKDFKNYVGTEESKSKKTSQKTKKEPVNTYGMNIKEVPDISEFDPKDVDMVKKLTKKYEGKENELVGDIFKLASKNKKEGKLNDRDLDNFEKKITPMLNSQQKKMLKDLMVMLKD